jgi:hypothetical protein
MQYSTRHITASAFTALGLVATMVACSDQPTAVGGMRAPAGARRAVVVAEREHYVPPQDPVTGEYLLDRVCDVFIGEQVIVAPDLPPEKYAHQVVVDVPAGSKIKLVGDAKTFTCNAEDPDVPGRPVIEPTTDHAAKGNGPEINTDGIDLDLNGYSVTVSPSATDLDPLYDNIGFLVTGSGVTLRNSAAVAADGVTGVSKISRFGHNIDIQAANPTLQGQIFGGVYNLETTGGMNVRLSSGTVKVDQVKSVDLDPVAGQGFEIRRCGTSLSTITNSYFVGGTEGVFIRECSGVTFEGNFVSGQTGEGITTREAISTTARPIVIRGNTVFDNGASGIVWGRDSRNNGGLVISGNTLRNYGLCGIQQSTRNATIAPLTLASLAASNTFDRTTSRTCRQ